jgi:hypothetical protein
MNVYYIDPTYVKPEGWKPLLTFLKVKTAYSFIPVSELPESLYSIIKLYLKFSYSNQDMKKFADNCAFWLRAHFERNIHLITDEYENVHSVHKDEFKKYSSYSALNNINNLDDENCLVLLKLKSSYEIWGEITAPECYVDVLQDSNLPTHITRYCLNILHKKYGHNQYQNQSAFVVFDEYFSKAFRFVPKYQKWEKYSLMLKNGGTINFMRSVNIGVKNNSPEDFPLKDVNGKKYLTRLRTQKGEDAYQQLIKKAKEAEEAYNEEQNREESEVNWQDDVDEMNRDFWRECGEGGSNCESWPGWD